MDTFGYHPETVDLNDDLDSLTRRELEEEVQTGYGDARLLAGGDFRPPSDVPKTSVGADEPEGHEIIVVGEDGSRHTVIFVSKEKA